MAKLFQRMSLPVVALAAVLTTAWMHSAQACEHECDKCEQCKKDGDCKGKDHKCDKCGEEHHKKGMMGGGWTRGLKELDGANKLTDAQWDKIKALKPDSEDRMEDMKAMMDAHKAMANALLAEGAVDEAAVNKARTDIDTAHKQKMDEMTATYRKIRDILTPAQRAALAKARAERSAAKDKGEFPTCDEHKKEGKKDGKPEGKKEMEHKH